MSRLPTSEELGKRRAAAVARGVSSVISSYVDTASGAGLRDVDGREWIDFASGIAVTSVGNAAPRVVEAVRAQVERFTHTCFMVAPYESYVAVCEQLIDLTPGEFEKRAALFNSGAEAVENAVKIARHATGRQAVVVFDHAYHGRTNLTMAMTAKAMPYKFGFGPFAPEVYRVPMSYPLRDGGLSGPEAAARAIDMIEKQVGAGNVAAVLIEPIQGEGGFVVPAPGFLPEVVGWARGAGAAFVADEIQTGFCRTGTWFASEQEGIEPDLVTTAKGMGGGLPIAGVVGRASADGRRARGWAGRHLRRQSGGVRGFPGGHRDDARAGPGRRRAGDRGPDAARSWPIWPRRTRASPRCAGGARCSPSSWSAPAPSTPDPVADLGRRARLPRGRPAGADLRHLRQRPAFPAAAGHRRARADPRPGDPRTRPALTPREYGSPRDARPAAPRPDPRDLGRGLGSRGGP